MKLTDRYKDVRIDSEYPYKILDSSRCIRYFFKDNCWHMGFGCEDLAVEYRSHWHYGTMPYNGERFKILNNDLYMYDTETDEENDFLVIQTYKNDIVYVIYTDGTDYKEVNNIRI